MNKKDTSIELLRVFAMIMRYHVFCHCINEQLISIRPNGFYSPDISMRLLVLVLVSPMGQMGNAIFIIISGYFMAHKGNNVDLTKTAKKLLSQLAFAAVIIGLAAIVTYNKFPQLSLELIDFNGFNKYAAIPASNRWASSASGISFRNSFPSMTQKTGICFCSSVNFSFK